MWQLQQLGGVVGWWWWKQLEEAEGSERASQQMRLVEADEAHLQQSGTAFRGLTCLASVHAGREERLQQRPLKERLPRGFRMAFS